MQGLPPLLELVSNQEYSTIRNDEMSQVAPSAIHFFLMVSAMDERMAQTHRFVQGAHAWAPIVSHVFFSLIWYMHLFRVYREAGLADFEALQFLQIFESLYDFRSLMVPGPLVPFLESLAVCSAHFNWFGDITPGMPHLARIGVNGFMNSNEGLRLSPHIMRQMPNPIFLMEVLRRLANQQNDVNANTYTPYAGINNGINPNQWANNMHGPTIAASLWAPSGVLNNARVFWGSRITRLPQQVAANVGNVNTWPKFFGLQSFNNADASSWLQTVNGVMQTYATFFRGSRPLGTILCTGLGAIIPRGIVQNNVVVRDYVYPDAPPDAGTMLLIGRDFPTNFEMIFEHPDHTLPELAEQYAALTSVNIDFSQVPVQHGATAIDDAHIRSGPFWTVARIRRSGRINVNAAYSQMVASHYHVSASLSTI